MEETGLIFDIQGHSVHDGPGSRTLVFLSGCPLRCEWCSNPEGMELRQRIRFREKNCVTLKQDCTRCADACPYNALLLTVIMKYLWRSIVSFAGTVIPWIVPRHVLKKR